MFHQRSRCTCSRRRRSWRTCGFLRSPRLAARFAAFALCIDLARRRRAGLAGGDLWSALRDLRLRAAGRLRGPGHRARGAWPRSATRRGARAAPSGPRSPSVWPRSPSPRSPPSARASARSTSPTPSFSPALYLLLRALLASRGLPERITGCLRDPRPRDRDRLRGRLRGPLDRLVGRRGRAPGAAAAPVLREPDLRQSERGHDHVVLLLDAWRLAHLGLGSRGRAASRSSGSSCSRRPSPCSRGRGQAGSGGCRMMSRGRSPGRQPAARRGRRRSPAGRARTPTPRVLVSPSSLGRRRADPGCRHPHARRGQAGPAGRRTSRSAGRMFASAPVGRPLARHLGGEPHRV